MSTRSVDLCGILRMRCETRDFLLQFGDARHKLPVDEKRCTDQCPERPGEQETDRDGEVLKEAFPPAVPDSPQHHGQQTGGRDGNDNLGGRVLA